MKKSAGWFLRNKLMLSSMYGIAGAGILMGLGVLPLFYMLAVWLGEIWSFALWAIVVAIILVLVLRLEHSSYSWNLPRVRKGLDGERRVGEVLQDAITVEHCTVVHSVMNVGEKGDIDHIVVTPAAIWVIETKYRGVERDEVYQLVNGIANNVSAVQKLAVGKLTVKGCLVLAYETGHFTKREYKGYKSGGGVETIRLYTRDSLQTLADEIRKDALSRRSVDRELAKRVRELGQVTE